MGGEANCDIKVLAMDVCVASSIYADMEGRRGAGSRTPTRTEWSWRTRN
jgi:hypothetical protein